MFTGEVTRVSYTRIAESHNFLVTIVTMDIRDWLYRPGGSIPESIDIVLPGGIDLDGSISIIADTPDVRVGETIGIVGMIPVRTPWRVAALDFDRSFLRATDRFGWPGVLNGQGHEVAGFGDYATIPAASFGVCNLANPCALSFETCTVDEEIEASPDFTDTGISSAPESAENPLPPDAMEEGVCESNSGWGIADPAANISAWTLTWEEGVSYLQMLAEIRASDPRPPAAISPPPTARSLSWEYSDVY